ncbi:hypothetical protein ACFYZ8_33360 [Streptomyces sp. NPDC001668]|uniref:hypothetical protein n=1 Tax=Streptomyces sp. NPDC001668 TaxID=3364598 RepID=UPI0036BE802D
MHRTDLLPLAQHCLPPGLPEHVYEDHNRRRKATTIAFWLITSYNGRMLPSDVDRITDRDMDEAADRAGVNRPEINPEETRSLVRGILRAYISHPDPAQDTSAGAARQPSSGEQLVQALVKFVEAFAQNTPPK